MAGFDVSYSFGKIVVASVTFPNAAMKFQGEGPMDLWFQQLTGSDRAVIDGLVGMPRAEHGLKAEIAMIVRDDCSIAGVAASNRVQQLAVNLGVLHTIAATSATSTPTQSFTFDPWVGATTRTGSAIILPPEVGTVIPGVGVRVVWDWVLPGGPPA